MRTPLLLACLTACGSAGPAPRPSPPADLVATPPQAFCVTRGALEPLPSGRLRVDSPVFRAVVPAARQPVAELRFTDLGPTAQEVVLASGARRRQIGLKLLAEDGCNLVYVMWRLAPAQELVVQVKRNPGERRHDECGVAGYRTVASRRSWPISIASAGSSHVLEAAITRGELVVHADGVEVWEGALPEDAARLSGPVGVRADNTRAELELRAALQGPAAGCRPDGD